MQPIDIASVINFRDLGGMWTRHGRRVRSRAIFRSGSLAEITDADRATLRELGVRVVWDLRSNSERDARPFRPSALWNPTYRFRDHRQSGGDIGAVAQQFDATLEASRELMNQAYRKFPVEQAQALRAICREVLAGALPMIINCMAGKDRTGVAAALLLDLLGVDRAMIMQDYLVSIGVADQVWAALVRDHPGFLVARRENWEPLVRCDPSFLDAFFETIDSDYGSTAAYFDLELGLSPGECAAIREQLLETAPSR